MGLKNSPPTFQKVMTNILKSCRAFCRSESRSSSPLLPPVVCSSQVRRRDESRPYAHTTSSEELQDHRSRQSQHNTGMQRQSSSSRSHLWPPVASCSSVQRREDNRRPTNNNQSSSRDYRTHHNRNQTRQPIRHPHEHLLKRKPENCPDGLTESQRTSWLKAGKQALENHQLNAVTPAFQYDKKHYGSPISIDYLTEDKTLTELISKFKSIKEYMIDTESDSNIGQPSCPRKQPNKPAIIQIQAIEKPIHLHNRFTNEWNKHHRHTVTCRQNKADIDLENNDCDLLYDNEQMHDLDEFVPIDNHVKNQLNDDENSDHKYCVCPSDHRPYKQKGASWSLQKAIKTIFNRAIDKELQNNFWSCGLDPKLKTYETDYDKETRQLMTRYAIN
ncbi:unnamed protein product, partial [Didymodactylos carnosus]